MSDHTFVGLQLKGRRKMRPKQTTKRTPRNCPRCGSPERIPYLYGEPTPEAEEMARAGKAILGGCCVLPFLPLWQCVQCSYNWGSIDSTEDVLLQPKNEPYSYQKMAMLRITAELMRRHGRKRRLLAIEIHPAGGQGYAIGLYRIRAKGVPVELGTLRSRDVYLPVSEDCRPLPYLELMRELDHPIRVVDRIEKYLRLPHPSKRKPWDAASFMFHLMSVLIEDYLTCDFSCGWWDSSGYEGSYVREEIKSVREFEPAGGWRNRGSLYDMLEASNYWILHQENGAVKHPPVVFDLRGKVWSQKIPGGFSNVFAEFEQGQHRLRPVIESIREFV